VSSHKAEFDRRAVKIVVVSFAEPEKLARYQERHRWPFMILADPERKAYQRLALKRLSWFRVFSPATLKLYSKLMREGRLREDYGREDIYQAGGNFLLDRTGSIFFAHRSQNPADRPSVQKLLQEIDSFQTRGSR
jgi:peroxiredoxin